jgi:hypothetical protein
MVAVPIQMYLGIATCHTDLQQKEAALALLSGMLTTLLQKEWEISACAVSETQG